MHCVYSLLTQPFCGQPEVCPGEEADLIDVDIDKKPGGGGGGGGGGGFSAPPAAMPMPMPMPMPTPFNYPPPNGIVRDFLFKDPILSDFVVSYAFSHGK